MAQLGERKSLMYNGLLIVRIGRVAQLGEHLLCKQGVAGSIPVTSTKFCLWLSSSDSAHL